MSRIPTLDDLAGGAWRRLTDVRAPQIDLPPTRPDLPSPRAAPAGAPPGSLAEELTPSASSPADVGPPPGRPPAEAPAGPRRDDEPATVTAAADQPPRREADDDEIDAMSLEEPGRDSELVHAGQPPQAGHANGLEQVHRPNTFDSPVGQGHGRTDEPSRSREGEDTQNGGPPSIDHRHVEHDGNHATYSDDGASSRPHDTTTSDTGSQIDNDNDSDGRAVDPDSNPHGWPPQEALDRIPENWGTGSPTKKNEGLRWFDSSDSGAGVRIDRGDPSSPWPSQRVDHVIVRRGGVVIGRDGRPITGSVKKSAEMAHIPLDEWLTWRRWFQP